MKVTVTPKLEKACFDLVKTVGEIHRMGCTPEDFYQIQIDHFGKTDEEAQEATDGYRKHIQTFF